MQKDLVDRIMGPQFKREHFGPAILKFLKKVSSRISRSKMSNLSLVALLSGILSLVFTAAGIFSGIVIALTTFPDLEQPGVLAMIFAKTCIPAAVLALAAAVTAVTDFYADLKVKREERIVSRSIAGLIMGSAAIMVILLVFIFFPAVTSFIAGMFSLPTGSY